MAKFILFFSPVVSSFSLLSWTERKGQPESQPGMCVWILWRDTTHVARFSASPCSVPGVAFMAGNEPQIVFPRLMRFYDKRNAKLDSVT
ncbi:hypothetical protein RUM43_002201 [Polyplax serrata]|uniref:Uncharacterized protein n=1 Tax=Polyplax serrata TaxID=468196 RepID=A0AAN8S5U2_POLSC